MLEFAVLGSGSSGNSAVVCLGEVRVLIDAGLSAKQLCLRLESLGIDPDSIGAIVLTHEHGDHSRGVDVFCRKRKLPIYGTAHTCRMVEETVRSEVIWRHFEAGCDFEIGTGLRVGTFSVPHDAVDPVGFVFRGKKSSLGVLSDVGHVTHMIVDHLRGIDALFTECNYDETMLLNDTIRPWATKQRISNRHGHLSNEQTADLVAKIASPNLYQIVLGHLSSDCNSPDLACRVISKKLHQIGHHQVQVECADRKSPLPLRPVARDVRVAEVARVTKVAESRTGPPVTGGPESDGQWRQSEWAF